MMTSPKSSYSLGVSLIAMVGLLFGCNVGFEHTPVAVDLHQADTSADLQDADLDLEDTVDTEAIAVDTLVDLELDSDADTALTFSDANCSLLAGFTDQWECLGAPACSGALLQTRYAEGDVSVTVVCPEPPDKVWYPYRSGWQRSFAFGTPTDLHMMATWSTPGVDGAVLVTRTFNDLLDWSRCELGNCDGVAPFQFGPSGGKPFVGDLDGDGLDEFFVYSDDGLLATMTQSSTPPPWASLSGRSQNHLEVYDAPLPAGTGITRMLAFLDLQAGTLDCFDKAHVALGAVSVPTGNAAIFGNVDVDPEDELLVCAAGELIVYDLVSASVLATHLLPAGTECTPGFEVGPTGTHVLAYLPVAGLLLRAK